MNHPIAMVLAAALAAAMPAPLQAADGAAATASSRTIHDQLAEAIVSEPRMISQSGTFANAAVDAMFAKETSLIEMEATYPGLRKTLVTTLEPLLVESIKGTIPLYRAELAALYAGTLSADEATEAVAFFRSPAAVRFFDNAARNMTYASVAQQLVDDRDASAAAMQSDMGNAARRVARTMEPTDSRALQHFFTSPTGRKLAALNPRKLPIDTKWLNYSPPEVEARVEQAILKAMIDHVAKTDPEVARAMRKELLAEPAKRGS